MSKEENLLKYENMKLKKQMIFTLPAGKEVCGRECPGCYAIKAQTQYHLTALPYRNRRLEASKAPDFVEKITQEIKSTKKKVNFVRVHESGDFYSQEYIDKWAGIAQACKDIRFYAFTKRKAEFDMSSLEKSPNFSLVDSLKLGTINYGSREDMEKLSAKTGAPICPETLGKEYTGSCGNTCTICMDKDQAEKLGVLFVKH